MNKDGVVSIGIEYKKEFNQMISDYESALSEMASNKTLSKGMKTQFENVIAELRSFKAEMDKQLSDLSVGKVDVTKFESFKKSVSKKFESINGDISTLNIAVSLLNEKMDMVGNGIDLSKVQNDFKYLEDTITRINNAVSVFLKETKGQGVQLFTYDETSKKSIQETINIIDTELNNLQIKYDKKFSILDETQSQKQLDKLASDLTATMNRLEIAKEQLSSADINSNSFKKINAEITAMELKASRLYNTIDTLFASAEENKFYDVIISNDKDEETYENFLNNLTDDVDSFTVAAKNAKKELEGLLRSFNKNTNPVQVSDKLNPNSAQLTEGLTIEADSDELWKKISPVLTDLQGKLNSNPVIAPVKLVVAPTAVSQNDNPDQSISTAYSKKYAKQLAKTGEEAVIDMEGVYKKTYTTIMDEAVKCAEESITKIQGIFENSPIDIKLQLSQEELNKINNFVLSNKDEKKIDISGQVDKVKTDISELNDKLKETTELIQKASQNGSVKFDGIEEFTKQITNSLSSLERLQDILKTLQNVEITLANASGLSSITEIDNQWESLSKRINNATKIDGTFRKNANVGKLAEEYQKYLDMGGKNELSYISKLKDNETAINTITSKMKELSSQKVDTSSIDKAVDSFDKFKSSLDDIISRLDHLISLTKDIGNTFYKMFKDASISDADKQWSSIESKFKSIANESGKINLSKQKKDVQELMEMYQKYSNAGGMKTPFDLTDNTETIKKLNKVYEQLNETKAQSKSDNKTISDLSEVNKSVDSLANNLENKLPQASNIAATAMEDSAERQILALTSVVDNINIIVEGLKKIKGVKIPTVKIDDGSEKKFSSKAETNISLGDTSVINSELQAKIDTIKKEKELLSKIRDDNDLGDYGKENSRSEKSYNETINSIKSMNASYEEVLVTVTKIRDLQKEQHDLYGQMNRLDPFSDERANLKSTYDEKSKAIRELESTLPILELFQDETDKVINRSTTNEGLSEFAKDFVQYISQAKLELGQMNDVDFASVIQSTSKIEEPLKEVKASAESATKELQKLGDVYRAVRSQDLEFLDSHQKNGAIWATSQKDLYNTLYTGGNEGKSYSAEYYARNPLVFDAKGQQFGSVTYLGDGSDEASRKITELYNKVQELTAARDEAYNSIGKESQEYIELSKQLGLAKTQYDELSKSKKNVYGTHFTDEYVDLAKANGYDGLRIDNIYDSTGQLSSSFAVWSQDQIKNIQLLASGEKELLAIHNQMKDAFPKTDTKLDNSVSTAKELDKTLEQVDIPTDSFDEVLKKLNLTKSELVDIVKITEKSSADKDGKHTSYTLKDSRGSTEIYGINSKTDKGQLLDHNIVRYDKKKDGLDVSKAQLEIDKQLAKEEDNLAKAQQKKAQAFLKEQANYEEDQKNAEFTKKQTAAYEELTNTISKYSEVAKRVSSGKAEDGDLELMTKLEDKISQLQKQPILSDSQVTKSEKSLISLYEQLDKIEKKLVETNQKSQDEQTVKFDKQKKLYINKLIKYTDTSKYTSDFVNSASTLQAEIGNLQFTNPQDVTRLQEIDAEVIEISNDSKLLENKLLKQQSKLAEIVSQMKIFKSQNTNMSSSQKAELDQIIKYAETMQQSGKEVASEVENIKIRFAGLKAVVNEAGNTGKNFFDQIGNRLTDMNSKFVAQFLSWQDWIRYIQQGISTIRDLDEAMTEVRKVSSATEAQYKSFQKTISSTAKEIASTNKELLNSSADFLRLGYSLDEASDLAKNATLFVNVGDGVDINAATEDMITAMKAFDIQAKDSIKIVDDYNQIGNMYALSATDIGEAMKRSASALETGNNSFEESIALITAMNEIVQNSENTGNTLKVFSLRLRGAKAELEDMGEDTDGLCDSTSKLREQLKSLTGVDIMLNDNTFKSTTQIVKELGATWDKLSDSSQAATLELVAGKTRANNVAALLKNYQQIDNVITDLGNAEGSAEKENAAIVDSINGRIKTLSATIEEFWQTLINKNVVKDAVTDLSKLIELGTKFVDTFGVIPSLSIGVGLVQSLTGHGKIVLCPSL